MSSPTSPTSHDTSSGSERTRRREKPPALHFDDAKTDPAALQARPGRDADGDASQVGPARVSTKLCSEVCPVTQHAQPLLHVSGVDCTDDDTEAAQPRSTSATSSLDPYYFGAGTPSESPVPSPMQQFALKTPELGPFEDPVTPHKNPAAIDRRGLVGVGELATPRWARGRERRDEVEIDEQLDEEEEEEDLGENNEGPEGEGEGEDKDEELDLPDSPWTIEAIDGELDDAEEVSPLCFAEPAPRSHAAFVLSSFLMCSFRRGHFG